MASEPIYVHDDSELPRLMDEASDHPVRFKRKGIVYRLSVDESEDDVEFDYDPEAAREALRATAGSWSDVDEKVIDDLYEWRRLGSRPITRP